MTSPKKQTAVTEYKPFIPALDDRATAMFNASQGVVELPGAAIKNITVRIGATSFDIPGDDEDDSTPVKSIRGIIVHAKRYRVMYTEAYVAGQVSAPACYSDDMQTGKGTPGGNCATCPMASFTKRADGTFAKPPCASRMYVYVLTPDNDVPLRVKVPSTSFKVMSNYFAQLGKKHKTLPWHVVTEIKIGTTISRTGKKQTTLMPSVAVDQSLNAKEKTDLTHYRDQFKAYLDHLDAQRGGDEDEAFDAFEMGDMTDAPRATRAQRAAAAGDDFEEKTYSPAADDEAY